MSIDLFSWAQNPASLIVVPIFFVILGLIASWIRHGIRHARKNSQWW